LQPYRQSTLKQKGAEKLQPHFYGPYRVTRRVGEVAYELELPPRSRIHNVFHVSCLKKVLGQQVTATTDLPPLDDEGHLVLESKAIVESREWRLKSRIVMEFLVQWKNLPDEDATWEGEHILEHSALSLLEVKHLCQSKLTLGKLDIKLLLVQNAQYLLQVLEVLLPCPAIDQDVNKKY